MSLYLAPHYDDVLLSLPARLLTAPAGTQVAVLFSIEDPALEALCGAMHAELGVTVYELGATEAVRRGVGLRECLRSRRRAADLDPDQVADLAAHLGALVKRLEVQELIAPQTRTHLDHALTRAAAERLAEAGYVEGLRFYADQPYATFSGAINRAKPVAPPACEARAPRARVDTLLTRLIGFVSPADVRRILSAYPADACAPEPLWSWTAAEAPMLETLV